MSEESIVQPAPEEEVGQPALRPRRYAGLADEVDAQRRRQRLVLMGVRTIFLALMVTVPLLPFVGALTRLEQEEFTFWNYFVPVMSTFLFGAVILIIDAATPHTRLASVFGIY